MLGGMLLDNTALDRVAEVISVDDFYREAHRKIFRAGTELSQRSEPIDLLTLSEALKIRGELAEVGGSGYISELADRALSVANIQYHARIVREKAILRGLIATAQEIVARGYEAPLRPSCQFVDEAEQAIYSNRGEERRAGSFVRVGDMITETFRHIEQLYERKEMVTGDPDGVHGLRPADCRLAAPPSSSSSPHGRAWARPRSCAEHGRARGDGPRRGGARVLARDDDARSSCCACSRRRRVVDFSIFRSKYFPHARLFHASRRRARGSRLRSSDVDRRHSRRLTDPRDQGQMRGG